MFFKGYFLFQFWTTEKGLRLKKYYMDKLDNDIQNHAGRWKLQNDFKMVNVENGITNNAAESLNAQTNFLKPEKRDDQQLWEGVLKLRDYENQLHLKLVMGQHGCGPMALQEQYAYLEKPKQDLPAPLLRQSSQLLKDMKDIMDPDSTDTELPPTQDLKTLDTVQKIAEHIYNENMVDRYIWPHTGEVYYHVRDPTSTRIPFYSVNVEQQACSCCATEACQHLIAVRRYVGLQQDFSSTNVKNTRKRKGTPPPRAATPAKSPRKTRTPSSSPGRTTAAQPTTTPTAPTASIPLATPTKRARSTSPASAKGITTTPLKDPGPGPDADPKTPSKISFHGSTQTLTYNTKDAPMVVVTPKKHTGTPGTTPKKSPGRKSVPRHGSKTPIKGDDKPKGLPALPPKPAITLSKKMKSWVPPEPQVNIYQSGKLPPCIM